MPRNNQKKKKFILAKNSKGMQSKNGREVIAVRAEAGAGNWLIIFHPHQDQRKRKGRKVRQ